MSTNETRGNESDDEPTVCPDCGTGFGSQIGMKIHFGKCHEGSLSGIEVDCDNCNTTFRKRPSEIESSDNDFCSRDCKHDYGSFDLECPECGDSFRAPKHKVLNSENNFCSHSCRSTYNARIYRTPDTDNKVTVVCDHCGDEYEKWAYRVGRYPRQFCSRECQGQHYSESGDYHGPNSAVWAGGATRYFYGPNWDEQRSKRLEKDGYVCSTCPMTNEEHLAWCGKGLHVHHIIPRSQFIEDGQIDYERANRVDNLITFCHQCHKKWEGIPLRPQITN